MRKGFTLVELIVVTGIILLFSALVFPNFNLGKQNLALERSAAKLAQDLSRAREMAMSMKEYNCPAGTLNSYGIVFIISSANYSLFARCDTNNYTLEILELEKGVKISGLAPASPLTITFTPPDPTTSINSTATITLTNDSQTKTIKVNKVGLINVE